MKRDREAGGCRKDYLGTKATTRTKCQEDPTPSLLSRSRARDCERPRLNHRYPRSGTSKGPGVTGAAEEDRRTLFGKNTFGKN